MTQQEEPLREDPARANLTETGVYVRRNARQG